VLPLLPGARACLARGLRSSFHASNAGAQRALRVDAAAAARPELEILFDPQTSGGLLFGVDAARAAEDVERLREGGDVEAAVIGTVCAADPQGALLEVAAGT
jgi:selenide,water dikinase